MAVVWGHFCGQRGEGEKYASSAKTVLEEEGYSVRHFSRENITCITLIVDFGAFISYLNLIKEVDADHGPPSEVLSGSWTIRCSWDDCTEKRWR